MKITVHAQGETMEDLANALLLIAEQVEMGFQRSSERTEISRFSYEVFEEKEVAKP